MTVNGSETTRRILILHSLYDGPTDFETVVQKDDVISAIV